MNIPKIEDLEFSPFQPSEGFPKEIICCNCGSRPPQKGGFYVDIPVDDDAEAHWSMVFCSARCKMALVNRPIIANCYIADTLVDIYKIHLTQTS